MGAIQPTRISVETIRDVRVVKRDRCGGSATNGEGDPLLQGWEPLEMRMQSVPVASARQVVGFGNNDVARVTQDKEMYDIQASQSLLIRFVKK